MSDTVACGGQGAVLLGQHCQRPPVDGDVLRGGEEIEEEKRARQFEYVAFGEQIVNAEEINVIWTILYGGSTIGHNKNGSKIR